MIISFNEKFKLRTVLFLITICMLMLLCIIRIMSICSNSKTADNTKNSVVVELCESRGEILDCNGKKLTSCTEKYANIFLPCEQAVIKFAKEANDSEKEPGLKKLKNNNVAILVRDYKIDCFGVYCYKIYDRYENLYGLEHLIGYYDSTKHGIVGLEKSFDSLLYSKNYESVSFTTNARGEFLLGETPEYHKEINSNALYLTVDRDIQSVCLKAAEDIKKGAVVVVEAENGKIRGIVSKPSYSIKKLDSYIKRSDSPLINRALTAFSVGSVYKPLIAAGLLENGKGGYNCNCAGYSTIDGIRFNCNNHSGHGSMNLKNAIARSCNTYFYNAARQVPPTVFTGLASCFCFGRSLEPAKGIFSEPGSVPSAKSLNSASAVANYAIGQGNILLSPLVMSNLYCSIVNEGFYYSPTLVEGVYENNKFQKAEKGAKSAVLSKATAAVLEEYLIYTVENGTGKEAMPEKYGAGGKTATAQTGQLSENGEKLNTWFCGFFPAEKPKYVVIVLTEEGISGSKDSAPIFKKIADGINSLKK